MAQDNLHGDRSQRYSKAFRKAAPALILVVFGTFGAFAIGRAAWRAKRATEQVLEFKFAMEDAIGVKNLWQTEKWTPEDFFLDEKTQRVCHAISSKDMEALRMEIASVDDVNQAGINGVTLLHWALFDDNLDAFQLLLQEGADPDATLSDFMKLKSRRPLNQGDSILFTAIHLKEFDFFYAALEHASDVNQSDIWGRSLLIAATDAFTVHSISRTFVNRLAERGIDLNQQDRYGSTAAYRAIESNRPEVCLYILQAGADPDIPTNEGENVADRLGVIMEIEKRLQRQPLGITQAHDDLQTWLESQ